MEKLFYYLIAAAIGIPVMKVFIFWTTQKILHGDKEVKRMDAASIRISEHFNKLLKDKAMSYGDINSIYSILKKYGQGKKYNSNIHLIYSVLKHEAVRKQDLGNIELILDTIAVKHKKKMNKLQKSSV